MSQFQKYITQGKNLYAIWLDDKNMLKYSSSSDNGQTWLAYEEISTIEEIHTISFDVDELGNVFILIDSCQKQNLYRKKAYETNFSLAFLNHEMIA